jgi:hypothetical protein
MKHSFIYITFIVFFSPYVGLVAWPHHIQEVLESGDNKAIITFCREETKRITDECKLRREELQESFQTRKAEENLLRQAVSQEQDGFTKQKKKETEAVKIRGEQCLQREEILDKQIEAALKEKEQVAVQIQKYMEQLESEEEQKQAVFEEEERTLKQLREKAFATNQIKPDAQLLKLHEKTTRPPHRPVLTDSTLLMNSIVGFTFFALAGLIYWQISDNAQPDNEAESGNSH